MPNYLVTANAETATPMSDEETSLSGIVTIVNQAADTDAFILHKPTGDAPTAAEVCAKQFRLGAMENVRDQLQLGSGQIVDLSRVFVATASGTAPIAAIGI